MSSKKIAMIVLGCIGCACAIGGSPEASVVVFIFGFLLIAMMRD